MKLVLFVSAQTVYTRMRIPFDNGFERGVTCPAASQAGFFVAFGGFPLFVITV